jgi:hypothetical protein
MDQHILTHIVQEVDLQKVRGEQIEKEKREGVKVKMMLRHIKRITTAGIVRCGSLL